MKNLVLNVFYYTHFHRNLDIVRKTDSKGT